MDISKLAESLAIKNKFPRAEKYDMFLREFDNSVEILGLVEDPRYDKRDFVGREMLFPKTWLTIGVLPEDTEVTV
jgi:hypothetical protein